MIDIEKYDLISSIISFINAEEYEATIENLARDCNVPLQYMRNTMVTLLHNRVIQSCINSYMDEPSFMEKFLDDPEGTSRQLLSGAFDTIEWEILLNVLDVDEGEILPLSHLEYGAFISHKGSASSRKYHALYEKKEMVKPLSSMDSKNLEIINEAIVRKKAITFTYKNQRNEKENNTIFPSRTIANVSDNWIYLQSADGIPYRLDRIVSVCRIVSNFGSQPETNEDTNQKYIWGISSDKNTEPVHVKLRIYDETSNIIPKIINDTRLRVENGTGKLYRDGDFYYYEDDVLGLNELQRWIRGYGSSILVLEPKGLRERIVARASETIDRYREAESWGNL